ncbi:MAG TPA: HAMP domain-containing sensor histidine kinase [Streptosporangiaceae bacterium]|nr:HAMP domain-containing sensor histidine kinase [Streptosporangiaceae bacterium]
MIRRPRRTVRMRLTALYCVLFVLSSIALLTIAAITNLGQGPVPVQQSLPEHSEISRYLRSSVIALGEMTVVSVAAGWLVAGRVLRPLRAMTATTRRISADNLHERLAIGGPGDELKDFADTIDALLGRLDGAFAAQRRFVANASHELRTPLATMRVSVDVAVAKPGPVPPETITLAGQVRTELDKVDELLEGLLALARAQHGVLPGHAVLPLDGIVAAALAAQAGAIAAGNLTVQHAGGDGIWVEGSQPLLRRMADNVIGNAVSHNRDGGWIRITATAGDGAARLVIENGGDILDPAQVAELAQPFRRLGADRTGSDDGTGLGLSIVAATAEAHGGSLDLQARPGGGLNVTITLPLAPRAPVAAGTGDRAGVPA